MSSDVKQIKYGDLESDFFGHSRELVQEAKNCVEAYPDEGRSAGQTFMQAYFGHLDGVNAFCTSMDNLCENTKARIKDAGAAFKDIDEKIASSIAKEG